MNDTERILEKLRYMEERMDHMQAILERTPLNDEMKTAVRIALDGEEWFLDMVKAEIESQVSNAVYDLEKDLDKKIEREVDNNVDYALGEREADVRELIRHVDNIQDEVDTLDGKVGTVENELQGVVDTLDDLKDQMNNLQGEQK